MISIIIPFRFEDQERVECLNDVLDQYAGLSLAWQIIIVEQDRIPRLAIKPRPSVQVVFAYNSGLFNRSWAFNVGVKNARHDYVAFCDADIIMSTSDFVDAVDTLRNHEAVNPYDRIVDLTPLATEKYRSNHSTILDPHQMEGNVRTGINFAGGMLLMRKESFYAINGWPEEIRGWGTEDNIMALKIERHLTHVTMPYTAYHLFHKPGIAKEHRFVEVNKAIFRSYQANPDIPVRKNIGDEKKFSGLKGILNELFFLLRHRRLVSSHYHYRLMHARQRDLPAVFKAVMLNPFSFRLMVDAARHLMRRDYAS